MTPTTQKPHYHTPEQIGYLIDGKKVSCWQCADKAIRGDVLWSRLFDVNIDIYNQSCTYCGTLLHEGSTGIELFKGQ